MIQFIRPLMLVMVRNFDIMRFSQIRIELFDFFEQFFFVYFVENTQEYRKTLVLLPLENIPHKVYNIYIRYRYNKGDKNNEIKSNDH